jgi:hypothetical protein
MGMEVQDIRYKENRPGWGDLQKQEKLRKIETEAEEIARIMW